MQLLQLYANCVFLQENLPYTHTVGSAADFCNTVRNSVKSLPILSSLRAEDFKGIDPVIKVCKIRPLNRRLAPKVAV